MCLISPLNPQGIAHQVCGCAFRSSLWLHRHIVALVKRNLRGALGTLCFDVMLDWLRFRNTLPPSDQDANVRARMEKMEIAHLHSMFGFTT